jgi:hypothetical protein
MMTRARSEIASSILAAFAVSTDQSLSAIRFPVAYYSRFTICDLQNGGPGILPHKISWNRSSLSLCKGAFSGAIFYHNPVSRAGLIFWTSLPVRSLPKQKEFLSEHGGKSACVLQDASPQGQ